MIDFKRNFWKNSVQTFFEEPLKEFLKDFHIFYKKNGIIYEGFAIGFFKEVSEEISKSIFEEILEKIIWNDSFEVFLKKLLEKHPNEPLKEF